MKTVNEALAGEILKLWKEEARKVPSINTSISVRGFDKELLLHLIKFTLNYQLYDPYEDPLPSHLLIGD